MDGMLAFQTDLVGFQGALNSYEYFYFLMNFASSGLSSIPVNRSTVM
jgi:hypothetical protein